MDTIDYWEVDGPLGPMLLAAQAEQLTGIWYDAQKYYPKISEDAGWQRRNTPLLKETARQLEAYFRSGKTAFDLPLAPRGTDFQKAIWTILQTIPAGQTMAYGDVARRYGDLKAVRAVGSAVGHNPISIVIPCHRVIGANGSLTGYAGGMDRKAWLLDLESGQQPMAFSMQGTN